MLISAPWQFKNNPNHEGTKYAKKRLRFWLVREGWTSQNPLACGELMGTDSYS
jgi:hypothetical protein